MRFIYFVRCNYPFIIVTMIFTGITAYYLFIFLPGTAGHNGFFVANKLLNNGYRLKFFRNFNYPVEPGIAGDACIAGKPYFIHALFRLFILDKQVIETG